jgi:hypothetical protein
MTPHDHRLPDPSRVPDEVAQRIFARAIELDEIKPLEMSLDDLRAAAREAGISPHALEHALTEFGALVVRSPGDEQTGIASQHPVGGEAGMMRRLWRQLAGRSGPRASLSKSSIWEALLTNVVAFAIFLVVYGLSNRITSSLGVPWEGGHLAQILADVLGVGIAVRLNARLVAFGVAGVGVSQLAKYLMHLGFGIESVQGGPTQLAMMIAGVLGAVLGGLIIGPRVMSRNAGPPEQHPAASAAPQTAAAAAAAAAESDPKRLLQLRARTI